ncbi:MAG TPA: cyclic nucleotide-binding domain-containing protein [Verrucomicrobiae bacterium]|nr:cyclic nucleotide-binding domain-containing protein [Verrucomicrobiae bacterium]
MNTSESHAAPAALQDVADHPFLCGLSSKHLDALADCAMRVHYLPGDLIFREGDPANRFYLLIKGNVILESEVNEKHAVIQTIGKGDVLGWSWLFPPYYSHFDARAVEPTDAMFFYGTRLREMCDADHSLGYEMLTRIAKVVIDRLVSTQKRLAYEP